MVDAWRGTNTSAISAESRAADAWGRIQRNPTVVNLYRAGDWVGNQTVRIEKSRTVRPSSMVEDDNTQVYETPIIIFGVNGHATVADFNVAIGDTFGLVDGSQYEIVAINPHPGETQAIATRYQN